MALGLTTASAAEALLGAATVQTPAVPAPLPDFSRYSLKFWDWTAPIASSEWSEPKLGGYDWRADHAVIVNGS